MGRHLQLSVRGGEAQGQQGAEEGGGEALQMSIEASQLRGRVSLNDSVRRLKSRPSSVNCNYIYKAMVHLLGLYQDLGCEREQLNVTSLCLIGWSI